MAEETKTGTYLLWGFLALLLLIGLVVLILWLSGVFTPTPSPSPPVVPPDTPPPPVRTGLWAINPGDAGCSLYCAGMDMNQAQNYCTSKNAQLATPDKFKQAHDLGFEYCKWGWLSDGTGALSMTQSGQPGCPDMGIHTQDYPNTTKLTSYCYGPVPDTAEVTEKIFF